MSVRLEARPFRRSGWGAGFWWFLMRYYTMPWFAWRWLRVRSDGELSPSWFKISQLGFNGLRMVLFAFLWLAFWGTMDLPALVTVFLGVGAAYNTASMVMRGQSAYMRYGGDRR